MWRGLKTILILSNILSLALRLRQRDFPASHTQKWDTHFSFWFSILQIKLPSCVQLNAFSKKGAMMQRNCNLFAQVGLSSGTKKKEHRILHEFPVRLLWKKGKNSPTAKSCCKEKRRLQPPVPRFPAESKIHIPVWGSPLRQQMEAKPRYGRSTPRRKRRKKTI